ncbi:MAG: ROK family protein [Fulvivirga sp.]
MNKIMLGVDIGGSHITAALVNLETRSILPGSLTRGHVNSQGTVEVIIAEWCDAIGKSLRSHNFSPEKIGIAMPGPFNYKLGISEIRNQSKYDSLYRLNIKELLASALDIPENGIEFFNDAECYLGGEVFCGAAKGCNSAIGLTLGTGLGTAWYRDEMAEDARLWKYPFMEGIAEDYLSTRWFIKRYNELSGRSVKDVKELAGITDVDVEAKIVFYEFGTNLSTFLSILLRKHNPELVVIGGNIAKAFDLFYPALAKGLDEFLVTTRIERGQLGEEAALLGAASCSEWKESEVMAQRKLNK